MKKLYAIVACLLLASCGSSEPQSTTNTDNPHIKVDKLFNYEGCTVYRFRDGGNYRYYARCESGRVGTTWTEGCGKNCTRSVEIQTAAK